MRPQLSGPASVALVPTGGGGVLAAGDAAIGVAWSTSKVPVAIAALRERPTAATLKDVGAAIRHSDNDAAERLWSGLGAGVQASAAVEAVLRDAGDRDTEVPAERIRPPYTAFGQTQWATPRAAAFASRLQCLRGAEPVLAGMRDVSGTQQWGFWSVDGAAVKGGWGPERGGYLVRQIAVVPGGSGSVGVAALVRATSFEAGQRDMNTIAKWVENYLDTLGGTCG